MTTPKVLIVEDHAVVSQGLVAMLTMSGEQVELVGVVTTGEDAVKRAEEEDVDVILMDVKLAGEMNGLEATRRIKEYASPDTKILVLTMFTDPATVTEAIKAGADGYLSKAATRDVVLGAVDEILSGRSVLDPQVTEGIFGRIGSRDPKALTDRELMVLQALSEGQSTKEVASGIHVSEETVKTYLKQIFRKLDVRDRTEAVAEGFRRGLVH